MRYVSLLTTFMYKKGCFVRRWGLLCTIELIQTPMNLAQPICCVYGRAELLLGSHKLYWRRVSSVRGNDQCAWSCGFSIVIVAIVAYAWMRLLNLLSTTLPFSFLEIQLHMTSGDRSLQARAQNKNIIWSIFVGLSTAESSWILSPSPDNLQPVSHKSKAHSPDPARAGHWSFELMCWNFHH